MDNIKKAEWVLRIGIFGTFLGHGIFALQLKPRFIEMLTAFIGVTGNLANNLMYLIGIIDIIVAASVLFHPLRFVLIYASIWGFLTALARPIANDPIWDFIERWSNWAAPLALLYLRKLPKNFKDLFK